MAKQYQTGALTAEHVAVIRDALFGYIDGIDFEDPNLQLCYRQARSLAYDFARPDDHLIVLDDDEPSHKFAVGNTLERTNEWDCTGCEHRRFGYSFVVTKITKDDVYEGHGSEDYNTLYWDINNNFHREM